MAQSPLWSYRRAVVIAHCGALSSVVATSSNAGAGHQSKPSQLEADQWHHIQAATTVTLLSVPAKAYLLPAIALLCALTGGMSQA